MKIYSTITSERATKSQGGNDHLLSTITVEINGQRQEIATMSVVLQKTTGNYIFRAKLPTGKTIEEVIKGEKKKSDGNLKCINCQNNFYGLEGKEDTCYNCLKKLFKS